jgi:uncharacterized protein DUF6249
MGYVATMVVFALLTAPVLFVPWLRSRERERVLKVLMEASEKGQALPPAQFMQPLINAVTGSSPIPQSERDERRAVFWFGTALTIFALALALYGFLTAAGGDEGPPAALCVASLGLIPAFIGAGYLMVARLARKANGGSAG